MSQVGFGRFSDSALPRNLATARCVCDTVVIPNGDGTPAGAIVHSYQRVDGVDLLCLAGRIRP
ncbi:MAG: hypothetical protein AB8G99_11050, partial [Planctomycetaceae bacterium]